jgi:adenosylcobinamide-phosphate synthase
MMTLILYITAFVADLLIGDPARWPHPVRLIGHSISNMEKSIRQIFKGAMWLYIAGGLLWLWVVVVSGLITWGILHLSYDIHWLLGAAVEVWLAFTVLATRCLKDCAYDVLVPLRAKNLSEARLKVSYIVGRDTTRLNEQQITRATVETVAENTVDGVIAPMFYLFIGGVPLAMAYKAINTLDSMVGYKNDRYLELGFVSAKMDDVANFIPARISWLLFTVSAWLIGCDAKSALSIGWRDRYQHKSPNSAWSEATMAGALGVQLGGPSQYFGQRVEKPWIGDAVRDIKPEDISLSTRLMYTASTIALVVFSSIYLFIH